MSRFRCRSSCSACASFCSACAWHSADVNICIRPPGHPAKTGFVANDRGRGCAKQNTNENFLQWKQRKNVIPARALATRTRRAGAGRSWLRSLAPSMKTGRQTIGRSNCFGREQPRRLKPIFLIIQYLAPRVPTAPVYGFTFPRGPFLSRCVELGLAVW